jgi:hypothetical protein
MSNSGILSEIFSSHAASQIMDFFIDHKEFDYSPSEIAQKIGLSFRTVFREIPNLEKYHLIIKNRKIGKTNMYILNSSLPAIKLLEKFALEMSIFHAGVTDTSAENQECENPAIKNTLE